MATVTERQRLRRVDVDHAAIPALRIQMTHGDNERAVEDAEAKNVRINSGPALAVRAGGRLIARVKKNEA